MTLPRGEQSVSRMRNLLVNKLRSIGTTWSCCWHLFRLLAAITERHWSSSPEFQSGMPKPKRQWWKGIVPVELYRLCRRGNLVVSIIKIGTRREREGDQPFPVCTFPSLLSMQGRLVSGQCIVQQAWIDDDDRVRAVFEIRFSSCRETALAQCSEIN